MTGLRCRDTYFDSSRCRIILSTYDKVFAEFCSELSSEGGRHSPAEFCNDGREDLPSHSQENTGLFLHVGNADSLPVLACGRYRFRSLPPFPTAFQNLKVTVLLRMATTIAVAVVLVEKLAVVAHLENYRVNVAIGEWTSSLAFGAYP